MPMYPSSAKAHKVPDKKQVDYTTEASASQKAIQGLLAGINKIAEATTAWGAKVSTVHQGLSRLSANLQQANNYTLSWARAGFAGTGQMALWEHHTFLLSRSIASIFIPTLEKLTSIVQKITGWFQSLTTKQQDLIAKVTVVSMGFVMLMGFLPKVSLAFSVIGVAIRGVGAAFSFLGVASGGIVPILGLIVAAIGASLIVTEKGRGVLARFGDGFAKVWKTLQPIVERVMAAIGWSFEKFFGVVWPMLERLGAALGKLGVTIAKALGVDISNMSEDFTGFLESAIDLVARLGTAFTEGVLGAIIASIEGLNKFLEAADSARLGVGDKKKSNWAVNLTGTDALKYIGTGGAWAAWDLGQYLKRGLFGKADESEGSGRFGIHGRQPKKDGKGRQFAETPGSFGDIGDLFRKIQQTVDGSGGKSPEEETAANTKDLLGLVREIGGALGVALTLQKPAVT